MQVPAPLQRIGEWLVRDRLAEMTGKVGELESQVKAFQVRQRFNKAGHSSGVDIRSGQFEYEDNDALIGSDKWDAFAKMANDPHVTAALRNAKLPLLNAIWEVEPASDDARDVEIAEFCEANILRRSTERFGREFWCRTPWLQRLNEVLEMLDSGFSMSAKMWRPVGTKVVLDHTHWLEPSSVDPRGWVLDETDQLVAIKRTYSDALDRFKYGEPISVEDIALFVWEFKGARFEGRPFTRAMYGAQMRKEMLQRWALIWAQKVGAGVPVVITPNDYSDAEQEEALNLVRTMRGSDLAHAFAKLRHGRDGQKPEVYYAGAENGDLDPMRGLINGENAEIAHAGGTKSMLLGETTSGSRALGESQSDREMPLVQAIAEVVAEQMTHGVANLPGIVEELVDRNYAGVEAYPRLRVGKIDPKEDLDTLTELFESVRAGVTPMTPELKRQVTERLGYVLPDEAYEPEEGGINPDVIQRAFIEAKALTRDELRKAVGALPIGGEMGGEFVTVGQDPPVPPNQDQPPPDEPGDEPEDDDAVAAASLEADTIRHRVAAWLEPIREGRPKAGGFRHPTKLEAEFAALGDVTEAYRIGERDCLQVLRGTRRAMTADLMRRARTGKVTLRNLDGQRRSKFRGAKKAQRALVGVFQETGDTGAAHVAGELKRQQGAADAALATPKIGGKKVAKRVVDQFGQHVAVLAEMDVGIVWDRMLGAFLEEYVRLEREGMAMGDLLRGLEAFLDDLSEKPLAELARTSTTVSYNQGRNMGLLTAAAGKQAQYAVRSEVLDSNTCEQCVALDGTIVKIGSPAYQELMPPARCLGRERCRGFYVILSNELTEAA